MFWINFLHFYQPPTSDKEKVIEATENSYKRIIKSLIKNPDTKFTININGCLLEKLEELNYQSLIKDIKTLVDRNQIEITGTAFYHPILPLIPGQEIKKQIQQQEQILKKYFGDIKLKGFFLPEMAYSKDAAKLIKELGYQWLILDEISHLGKMNNINLETRYIDKESGLVAVFRQRLVSESYVPKKVSELLDEDKTQTLITATDAELYGLRHKDVSGSLEKLLKKPGLKIAAVSEFIEQLKKKEEIKIVPSSWESTEKELRDHKPYALWYDRNNNIHRKLWRLAKVAWEVVERHADDENYQWAQLHLNRGLASCTFWWASGRNFHSTFGSLSWNPDEIERGLNELIRAVRALNQTTTRHTKIKAEKIYIAVKKIIWTKHWTYYWKK